MGGTVRNGADTKGGGVWSSLREQLLPIFTARPRAQHVQKYAVSRVASTSVASPYADYPSLNKTSAGSPGTDAGAPVPPPTSSDWGYERGAESRFTVLRELGRGGNGVVTLVRDETNGQEYAMKSIPKALDNPKFSDKKRSEHGAAVRREVEVLRRLRGCLNVAALEEVYEDDSHVHLVMEACRGGELHHALGTRNYSERTVASLMRAVLRTLAQCHAQKILHRDIKPGNFLLAAPDDDAPLKAVDFGLAVFYDDRRLPRTDLGLEGTPWFMAPETLRSEVYPSSDVWSAGVMAAQLLTGRFPFDDRSSPHSPSLSKIWKSILCDELNLASSAWADVTPEARDFVASLLNKDPLKRPSAREALRHPWLRGGIKERFAAGGRPLSLAVVQRIQRFAQSSVFKRSVLEHIAEELLADRQAAGEGEGAVTDGEDGPSCRLDGGARPLITRPRDPPLEYLYDRLGLREGEALDADELATGLRSLGYRLSDEELRRLMDQIDPGSTGRVSRNQLAASQIDWAALQSGEAERWLRCARRAFADLDGDGDGVVSVEDMVSLLRHKLPAGEVAAAVRHALAEAARTREEGSHHSGTTAVAAPGASQHGPGGSLRGGLNFRAFMRMLRAGSADSLDLYDDRLANHIGSPGSADRVSLLMERSVKGGERYMGGAPILEAVAEEK